MAEDEPTTASLRRAALICNSRSRRGKEWYPAVIERLKKEGFDLVFAENFNDPSKVGPAVKRAVFNRVPLVIVGGGDGTMSSTASILRKSDSVMGVLPLGTGNAFARDLGIPSDVEGACRVLAEGSPRLVDLGIIGNKNFVNVVTVGLTARIAEALTDSDKKKFGRFVYAIAIARAVVGMTPFRAVLTKPDGVETFETMQIVFGSGRFHAGPFPVTPDAEITDHYLNGYVLKGTSKGALLKFAFSLWGGHHVNLPEVESFTLKSATLETNPRKHVVVDGEVSGRTPIEVAIDPGALRVMVARDFSTEPASSA